ncbi:MAG: peptidase S41 [Bacteroidales bacterium]|nr:peptidase S41 [Bacteroidales bacterium]
MKKIIFIIGVILLFHIIDSFGQQTSPTNYNLDFEANVNEKGSSEKWYNYNNKSYIIEMDTVIKHGGKSSVLIYSVDSNAGSETLAKYIPMSVYGKKINVKAYIKFEELEGSFELLVGQYDRNQLIQSENSKCSGIRISKNWMEYSVNMPLSEDVNLLFLGIYIYGQGKIWIDDITISIDNENFTKTKQKKLETYKADSDTIEFKENSKINVTDVYAQQIENLDKLGRIWGMLKYYHPAIARGEYNWDYELFRIMPDIITAETNVECNNILLNWVHKFGNLPQNNITQTLIENLKMKADLAWTDNDALLGREMVLYLDSLENVLKESKHYYLTFVPEVGNPVFKNENIYLKFTYPDAGYRLLALFRFWNAIHYYFPYKYLIDDNWNNVLNAYIPKFINADSELNYELTVLELLGQIYDTHAQMYKYASLFESNYLGNNMAPYILQYVEDKAVVKLSLTNHFPSDSNLLKGDIIISINKITVEDIIKARSKYVPASNNSVKMRDLVFKLLRTQDSTIHITYERDGIIQSQIIRCFPENEVYNSYYAALSETTPFRFVHDSIAYIDMKNFDKDSIENIMEQVKNMKGLIIDLRCYPSDFEILFPLSEYLMPEPKSFVKFSRSNLRNPGDFVIDTCLSIGIVNNEYFKGKIIILTNEETQSMAEYFAMAFRAAPQASVIGSTTAGTDGNVSYFDFPGRITTLITGIGIYSPDGRETQRVGIIPDIEAKPTIQGIRDGRDEVLEKAIEVINRE